MADDMKYEYTDKPKAVDAEPKPEQYVPAKATDSGLVGFGSDKPEETAPAPVETASRGFFGYGAKKEESPKSEETSPAPATSLGTTALNYFGFGKKKEEDKCDETPITTPRDDEHHATPKADDYDTNEFSAPKADHHATPMAEDYSPPKADDYDTKEFSAPKAEESTTDRSFLGFGKKEKEEEEDKCDEKPVIAAPKTEEEETTTADRGFLGFGKKEENKCDEPIAAPKADEAEETTTADRGFLGFGKKKEDDKCDEAVIAEPKSDEYFPPKEEAKTALKTDDYPVGEEKSTADRGLFGFGKKKEEEKNDELAFAAEFDEKAKICEDEKFVEPNKDKEEETKHESLLEKLRGSDSSSSSSDEEEIGEHGEKGKKKKKKGVKAIITDKIKGNKLDEEVRCEDHKPTPVDKYDTAPVPVPTQQHHHEEKYDAMPLPAPVPPPQYHEEKYDSVPVSVPSHEHEEKEKKGFLEKIKEKLPGGKKPEEMYASPPPESDHDATTPEAEVKEKKGFMDKIKDKIPGYHHKTDEEKAEKEMEKERKSGY